jgi:enoyl-CoA hydratase/carnithine racemase
MRSFQNLSLTVEDGLAEILLDNPEKLNAFDERMLVELNEAIQEAMTDDRAYVVIISGRGRGFCSGADVSNMDDREDRQKKLDYGVHLWKVQNVDRLLLEGSKPVIAAVNGPAIGAGCDFALACDLRVMSESAYLRQQFVNIGLVPGDGGAWLLPRLVGESKAKELILTGRDVGAAEAEEIGLAVDVVEDGHVLEAARELATDLRDKPALALQNTKGLIDVTQSFEDYAHEAFQRQWECINDPEQDEAIAALQEGRDPVYDREY